MVNDATRRLTNVDLLSASIAATVARFRLANTALILRRRGHSCWGQPPVHPPPYTILDAPSISAMPLAYSWGIQLECTEFLLGAHRYLEDTFGAGNAFAYSLVIEAPEGETVMTQNFFVETDKLISRIVAGVDRPTTATSGHPLTGTPRTCHHTRAGVHTIARDFREVDHTGL